MHPKALGQARAAGQAVLTLFRISPDFFLFLYSHSGSRPTQRQATPRRVTSARPVRASRRTLGPGFRLLPPPRLLSQDGGSSGRVLQRWEPGVVPDVPGTAAAGRGGSL